MVSRLKRQFNRHCIRIESILKTGLEEEAAFQSGIQMASASWLPFDEVAFTEDMMFSAAWSVQDRTPLKGQMRTFTQILQEMYRRSQPLLEQLKMSAVPHQHYPADISVALVINIMYSIVRQDNMLPTRPLQGHNGVSAIEATGVLEEFQELLSSNRRQNLIEDFGRPRWTARRFSVPELPGKASEGVVHADTTEARRQCDPLWLVPTPALGKQASGTEAQRQRQRNMRIALLNMKKGAIAHCTPGCSVLQAGAHIGQRYRPPRDRGGQLRGLQHGGEDPSYMRSETQK